MANILEICRICLSVNAKMLTLKNTNFENLYTLLTQVYIDIEDGKPTTVCFLCYARLQKCNRLQQQAIKANELLEQLLKGGIMHATAISILNSQYNQDLQVTTTYYLDLGPVKFKDDLLHPKVEHDSLISVKEEVEEAMDEGLNMTDFPEDATYSYDFDPNAIHCNPEYNQLIAISSDKSDDINDIAHGTKWRERKEEENLCLIKQEKEVKTDPHMSHSIQIIQKDKTCSNNQAAKGVYMNFRRKLEKTKIRVESNEQKTQKPSQNESTQKECVKSPKTPVINVIIDECNKCGKQFSTEDILTDHILKCKQTTENFLSENQLTKTDELNTFPLYMYRCDICNFGTNLKHSIEMHLKMHNVTKVLSCNICEYRCAYESELKRHVKKHTDEKPFFCNICEYRCARKGTLKIHMKTHTGEKPFSCNICEYKCAHKFSLKTHMRNHTGERPFSCNICEYRCSRKSDLNTHIKTHTGEKPFSCNICRYRCIRKGDLKTHMRNHIGEKPFSCTICEYRCSRKVHIKQHMIKHTHEKPYSCNICEYRCARKGDLNKHTITHFH